MGKYISVCGCIICNKEQVSKIKQQIFEYYANTVNPFVSEEQRDLYLKGWVFPDNNTGWMKYIFFGCDIRTQALEYIKALIEKIRAIQFELDGQYDDNVEGFFYFLPEEGQAYQWVLKNRQIIQL